MKYFYEGKIRSTDDRRAQAIALTWVRGVYEKIERFVTEDEKSGRLSFAEALLVEDDRYTAEERRETFIYNLTANTIEYMCEDGKANPSEDGDSDEILDDALLNNTIWDEAVNHGYLRPEEEWNREE